MGIYSRLDLASLVSLACHLLQRSFVHLLVLCEVGCCCMLDRLSPLYPEKLIIGMELREKVSAYVRERIGAPAGHQPALGTVVGCLRQ